MASATLLVKDIVATRHLFEGNGIRFRKVDDQVAVDPSRACGAHLYFKQV